MDEPQYTSLLDAVVDIPDPRKARGKRHPWAVLLTLSSAALRGGQRTGRAIGHWVDDHQHELMTHLALPQQPLPSPSTRRRALCRRAVTALAARLAQFAAPVAVTPPPATAPWPGQAVDGQAVRGAQKQREPVHLVSLVCHGSGVVRTHVRVRGKRNEITTVPLLLKGRDVHGTVTTMDALLTHQAIARQIRDQHGHYLMVVKEHQPALSAAIDLVFRVPPPPLPEHHLDQVTTLDKGHGRLETRTLERTGALNGSVDGPAGGHVLRRTCQRITRTTGEVSEEVTDGVTSLGWQEADARLVEA